MKISIDAFTGAAPKLSPTMLPNSSAQVASNVKLISGSLKPVNTPKLASSSIIANATSVYMLGAAGAGVPLSWVNDVDVAASPVSDSEYRIYYTGDGGPKKSSAALAGAPTGGPVISYDLGVAAPDAITGTPSAVVSAGGSVPAGTYVYVYTYETLFGGALREESAPSQAVTVTVTAGNQTVTLSGLDAPTSLTNNPFSRKKIYRSTGTTLQLVGWTTNFTDTTFVDSFSAAAISKDALATDGWIPPPTDLQGISTLPSSVLVGFRGNEVWFSEPGFPHAWPAKYMQAFDTPIVGLKTFGNNVVLGTQSFPYSGGGVHPDSFTFQKLPMLEPCLAKRSMASDEFGVLYASANGLVAVGNDFTGVVSANFIARDTFAIYAPDTFTACVYERRYYGFYSSLAYGSGAWVYARNESSPVSNLTMSARAVLIDQKTAKMLLVDAGDGKLYQFDPIDTLPYTYTWKSKLFQAPSAMNLGCFRINGQEDSISDTAWAAYVSGINATITAANASAYAAGNLLSALGSTEIGAPAVLGGIGGSTLAPLIGVVSPTVGVTVFAGRNPVLSGNYALNTTYRLPAGFRALGWEVSITGQREVRGIIMATSPQELNNG